MIQNNNHKKLNRVKYITFVSIFLIFSYGCQKNNKAKNQEEDVIASITYQSSNEIISNPERGFMHTWMVHSEGEPMSETSLTNLKNENVTLILRLYYLENFKDSPLSQTQLDLIKTDFARLRNTGIKCVLRFAYTDEMEGTDAPLNIIESHLDQLQPIIEENADVIAFVQAGFIGAWGEWYFSTNGLATTANRKAVLTKLLQVFPDDIKIQVRTPLYKQNIFEYSTAIDSDTGYGTANIARVGFHNDCFMASTNDYGTYQDIDAEKSYISKEALFVPTGGETCPPTDVPLASCSTAETEMSLLKWTYLNLDYYGPVLQGWKDANCFDDFSKKLGYRLALKSSELPMEVSTNGTYTINAVINNLGYAPVYNTKDTFLVFRSTSNGTLYTVKLDFDVRKVIPNVSYELSESVTITNIPAGTYELLLKIEDIHSELKGKSAYNIRFANTNVWETSTGLNKLNHTVTIK